ncbi:hypothetical protein L249_7664 [Ophiocordyceps polyrhachis-furcata BCC 54312]|uniref:Deoxyribonuclease NucA/NucB domain-containing protein n=1 Tax=Ophiocordyceps polyrhachis-furcata BCC 54312 TaxID=1330021 RepID=A0A367LAC6_9HYPO|nr:hypothetical protein L249_7664 [Ophiocordyceps polyrhachis-furcata BCC 54312]
MLYLTKIIFRDHVYLIPVCSERQHLTLPDSCDDPDLRTPSIFSHYMTTWAGKQMETTSPSTPTCTSRYSTSNTMLPSTPHLLLAMAVTGSLAAKAVPPDVTFLCQDMPDICTNICWAMRCASPTLPGQLTLDFPSEKVRRQRLESSDCARCSSSSSPSTNNSTGCNLYPPPETSESTGRQHVSRCVPAEQQSKQDAAMAQLVEAFRRNGRRSFRINLGNPGAEGVKYCLSERCGNDSREEQTARLA